MIAHFETKLNPFVSSVPFLYPLKTSENFSFLMFSGGRERVHWEQMVEVKASQNYQKGSMKIA